MNIFKSSSRFFEIPKKLEQGIQSFHVFKIFWQAAKKVWRNLGIYYRDPSEDTVCHVLYNGAWKLDVSVTSQQGSDHRDQKNRRDWARSVGLREGGEDCKRKRREFNMVRCCKKTLWSACTTPSDTLIPNVSDEPLTEILLDLDLKKPASLTSILENWTDTESQRAFRIGKNKKIIIITRLEQNVESVPELLAPLVGTKGGEDFFWEPDATTSWEEEEEEGVRS